MTPSKLLEHLQLLLSNREERLRSQFDEWYWVMGIFKNLRTWSRQGTIQEWWHVAIRGRSRNNHDTGASRARRQCKHSFSTSSRRSEGERRKKGCQQQTGETHRWLTYNMSPRRRTNCHSIANARTTTSQTKTRRDEHGQWRWWSLKQRKAFSKRWCWNKKKTMNSTDHCCKQYHVVI